MSLKQPLFGIGVVLSSVTFNAHASLTGYTGAGNSGLVYSSVSDITWTRDANLLATLENSLGYTNVINAIIAASPTIYSTPNAFDTPSGSGYHTVAASDFVAGGLANWFGAQAFIGYLNSISYGGGNQWRLPTSNAIPDYNGTAGNELGQLFYSELGGAANSNIPDTDIFDNEQPYEYWSGTEYAPGPNDAWGFGTTIGIQESFPKNIPVLVWAVSPGQVAAVPVPGALWLFGTGLVGLASLKRRGSIG